MRKITEQEVKDHVADEGMFEKEHRKYSSFYCSSTYIFTQDDVDMYAQEGVDASDFLNVQVTMHGTWGDSWGTEWDETIYEKVGEYQELVPEKVIPAHYITKQKTEVFIPTW
jgi:hypothetical protein